MYKNDLQVSLDDGPGPSIKYQYAELGKLYQVSLFYIMERKQSSGFRRIFTVAIERLFQANVNEIPEG